MNNLSFTTVVANYWGLKSIFLPASGMAYTGAALNGIVFLGACLRLMKRSKEDPLVNYIFALLAGFFGVLGNAIFYSTTTHGKGFWIVGLGYHSFVWLSCMASFLPLSKALANVSHASRTGVFSQLFAYLAYFWLIVSISIGIAVTAMNVDASEIYYQYSHYSYSALIQFLHLTVFIYFSNWGFVSIFIILYFTLFTHINTMPSTTKSMALFGLFATVPVITDTIVVYTFHPDGATIGSVITSMVVNFIFTDCFSIFTLVTVLLYAKCWVYSNSNFRVADEATHY